MSRQIILATLLAAALGVAASSASGQTVLEVIADQPVSPESRPGFNPYADDAGTPAGGQTSPADAPAYRAPVAPLTERPLWQALADGDWNQFDALTQRMMATYPGWQPSPAMMAERAAGERNERIASVMRSGDPDQIVLLSKTEPSAFDCARANNLWLLADAHLQRADKPAAMDVYARAVATCPAAERLAAIQKARAAFPLEDVLLLIDRPGIARHPTETAMRAEIAKAIDDMTPKPAAPADPLSAMLRKLASALDAARPGDPVPVIAYDAATKADASSHAKAAELLGWLHHKHGDHAGAASWFRKATSWGNSKDAKAGLIYALAQTGEEGRLEARRLAETWPGTVSPSMFAGDRAVEAIVAAQKNGDWARCRALADGKTSHAVLLVGAWCDHEAGQSRRALDAFKAIALAPGAKDGERADAQKGWVITARALHDGQELDALIARGFLSADEKQALTREIGIARFWTAYEKGQYRTAMNIIEELSRDGVEITDKEAMTAGWAAYNAGECGKAWTLFSRMKRSLDPDIRDEAFRGFKAVQGALESDRHIVCGRDQSTEPPSIFTSHP